MKRIYHPYTLWEEVEAGMWSRIKDEETMLQKAIEFTGNASLYGEWMIKVIDVWPFSCENSLSATEINRKAWVGHAAACLAIGSPEYITRKAWGFLTPTQQDLANNQALNAIKLWERNRRLKAISELGKNAVTWKEYPTAHQANWKQQVLYPHTGGYVGQS